MYISKFTDSGIYGGNIQHSVLAFHQENTIVTKEKMPGNIANEYVIIFEHSQQFCL